MGFRQYYNQEEFYPVDLLFKEKLDETTLHDLMRNTDQGRLQRAINEVRTNPPRVFDYNNNVVKLEYNFKSFPSVEMKRHKGFVIHEGDKLIHLFCDCKDFFYRLWTPLVEANLSKYSLPTKFDYVFKENGDPSREWTNRTNPEGKLFVCKHLAAMKDYIV